MEVHHSHGGHGKKKFKEYFLEFLMIFLAVTMGFFAESLREHITENKKEKEFIKGLIADLKADTAKLNIVLKYYDKTLPIIDSGRKNFDKLKQPGSMRTLAQLQFSFAGYQDFIYTDATLQQLRSSGGMMLIKKKAAVDSVLAYDSKVKASLINEKVLGELMIDMQHSMSKILNMQPLLETAGRATDAAVKKAIVDSLNKHMPDMLLVHDAATLGQFYNDYTYYAQISTLVKMQMAEVKALAIRTIAALKKMYGSGVEED